MSGTGRKQTQGPVFSALQRRASATLEQTIVLHHELRELPLPQSDRQMCAVRNPDLTPRSFVIRSPNADLWSVLFGGARPRSAGRPQDIADRSRTAVRLPASQRHPPRHTADVADHAFGEIAGADARG